MDADEHPGPSAEQQIAAYRKHLDRESDRRRAAEACAAILAAALGRLALIDEMAGMGVRDGDPELTVRCRYAARALERARQVADGCDPVAFALTAEGARAMGLEP